MASETSIIREGKVVLYPGSPQETIFDPAELTNAEVRDWLVATALQRINREASAGKTETEEERNAVKVRCLVRFANLKQGIIAAVRESVSLSAEELADAEFTAILAVKRLAGDARPEKTVRSIFNALPDEKKEALRKKYAKQIKKAQKTMLASKRKPEQQADF